MSAGMHVAVMAVGFGGGIVACRFLTRGAADAWAESNNAEILAFAPLMSLAVARAVAAEPGGSR